MSQINKIEIKELFGYFNYNLVFSENQSYIKIITAPNGYGKSTILNIIEKFSKNDLIYFIHLKFSEIKVYISGYSEPIIMRKIKTENTINEIKISHMENNIHLNSSFFEFISNLENHLPIYRKGEGSWVTLDDDSTITLIEILNKYKNSISVSEFYKKLTWLVEITDKLNVKVITTNRLMRLNRKGNDEILFYDNESKMELTVFDIQNEIKTEIQKSIRKHFQEGRYRENTFAKRLVSELDKNEVNLNENIKSLIFEINQLEQRFISLGILKSHRESNLDNIQELLNSIHDRTGLKVLSVYLGDIVKKLHRLTPIANKLEILKNTLNDLFSFKKVRFSIENGLEITSDFNSEKEIVNLSSLSSGEQHLILLLGKMIFENNRKSLVLIDEPEISFHPEWQERFIEIINNIREINDFSIIISTHSPSLINGNWDNVIELSELTL